MSDCASLEEIDAFLDGGSTDVTRRLDLAGGAVSAAAVTTLEHDGAHVLFTQRTVDSFCQWLSGCLWLVSAGRRLVRHTRLVVSSCSAQPNSAPIKLTYSAITLV